MRSRRISETAKPAKMAKDFKKVGQIRITGQTVNIMDTCYDRADVPWITTIYNMVPGTYDCWVELFEKAQERDSNGENIHCRCISRARIILANGDKTVLNELERRIANGRPWRYIGGIGVDSGVAGFFDGDKPDFTNAEWHELEEWMKQEDRNRKVEKEEDRQDFRWYIRSLPQTVRDGFWTSTGYGGGSYPVYAIHSIIEKKRKTTAAEIRFL